ncbi:MAG: U32 family peptidase, partial [Lachnospiraceae bacterium]|nr:U32 family peptidase [Lachnospiraceae bacterium]
MNAELLAPAGSFEALEAALVSGADAVYLGGTRFGARAYADNLNTEDLCRAIDLVHRQDKKLYMTVNTLLKEKELEEDLYQYLLPYYREGLDGVIVQDLGVVQAIRQWFPHLPVHGSTQMAITGASSAELLKQEGLTRVVPARELSLKEIREIYKKTGLEIECFIHGALCYSYSGMCLMSSLIGGRSGNRGRCAGTCRLPYEVYENGKKLNGPNTAYPLNTRDMCTVELLPEILDAGVCSLKIEGRMKKPEYTAGVVSVYRKYLDLLAEYPEKFRVEKK